MIIGQQQLESLTVILNLLKNKNKEEKGDIMKKNNMTFFKSFLALFSLINIKYALGVKPVWALNARIN